MRLNAANTAIVLDSTADLPDAQQRFPNWRLVPLYVRFGDKSFKDYVELGPEAFYERLRTSPVKPSTSQPTPGDFGAVYDELASYERVYSLQVPATLSGTIQSARVAAEEHGDKIKIVDTGTASAAEAMLAFAIQRRLERGTTDEEIDGLVERFKREAGLLFTVDTLEFLRRGGRIGAASAWIGSTLRVKPILTLEGEMKPVERVRTSSRMLDRLVEYARQRHESGADGWAAQHINAQDQCDVLVERCSEVFGRPPIMVSEIGPVLSTHTGPGLLGVGSIPERFLA